MSEEIEHGTTYAAYQRCLRSSTEKRACDPCRKVHADWVREYRANRQPRFSAERARRNVIAYGRALRRLAEAHPAHFRALLKEERARCEPC